MSRLSISGTLAVATLLAAASCNTKGDTLKYDSKGAPYEIVVVADHDVWKSPAGDTLRAMFNRQYPMINRQETTFDILRVLPGDFKKHIARYRNVLIADIDATRTEPAMGIGQDVNAKPQTVMSAVAPDAASLTELIAASRDDIMRLFEKAEKDRDVAAATGHTPPQIATLVKEKFGFEMSTGPGYTVRSESEDFLWLSYELPTSSQGIIIYTYPFSGSPDMTRESLVARRNEFVARIPGENPGSHMSTNPEMVDLIYKTIDGRPWSEMHGFWNVEGDFMGGPYTNYSTLDTSRGRIVAIDFYVYSPDPRRSQRNYIRQLEHLIYTVKLP